MAKPPSPPYIAAKYQGGAQKPKRIVLHSTVSKTKRGGAKAIATYFRDPTYPSSAHYVVDPYDVYQCVKDHTQAWHDGHNQDSLGVEMCDMPHKTSQERWKDEPHKLMLARTAKLVRQLCQAYDIPMDKITPAEIRAGRRGIHGHADTRDAFPGSTSHWDPGAFPWSEFIRLVKEGGDWLDMADKNDVIKAVDDSWTHKHVVDIKQLLKDFVGSTEKTPRQLLQKAAGLHDNVLELQRESDAHTSKLDALEREVVEMRSDIRFLVEEVKKQINKEGK